jgi:hypothetical protein
VNDVTNYRVVGLYRRTVSAVPALKRLIPVTDIRDEPLPFGAGLGQLCPDVVFRLLADGAGVRYWGKQWINARQALLDPTWKIECFLATWDRKDLCLAREVHPCHGLVYRFDGDLFSSNAVVHQWDCPWYFDEGERQAIARVASAIVRWPGLPSVRLDALTDFQVARGRDGLVFLDFEPSRRYALELAGVAIP